MIRHEKGVEGTVTARDAVNVETARETVKPDRSATLTPLLGV